MSAQNQSLEEIKREKLKKNKKYIIKFTNYSNELVEENGTFIKSDDTFSYFDTGNGQVPFQNARSIFYNTARSSGKTMNQARKPNNITRKNKNTKVGGREIEVEGVGKWDVIDYDEDYGRMTYPGDVFEGMMLKHKKYKKDGMGIMTSYENGKKKQILGYWKDDNFVNSLDESLGEIHRVDSPDEIIPGKNYLVMHNDRHLRDNGRFFLFIGNIDKNPNYKVKPGYSSESEFILNIIWEKDLTVSQKEFLGVRHDEWRRPISDRLINNKYRDDGGAKYRLHTGTLQHDSLMQNQIRYNPFNAKQFNIVIFAFDEERIERVINRPDMFKYITKKTKNSTSKTKSSRSK